ncbi:hypothetical protein WME99_12615 [Sorangium sp. So ce136]|uniref:hypothetical protein n=1 Tax=Sorangium sp. So ce136 TaxID=3133284 RepID=UPI003F07C841
MPLNDRPLEGQAMLYVEAKHSVVAVGQVWRCVPQDGTTAVVVAVDQGPTGFAMNVILEDGRDINGVRRLLAPIGWEHLETHLDEVLSEGADVSEHRGSYEEWKELAQKGKAGYFTCTPGQVLSTARRR